MRLKLTRFGGAVQAFRGGFTDAQDTSAICTGISPSNSRTGPRRPRSGRACPGVRTDRTVDQPLGGASDRQEGRREDKELRLERDILSRAAAWFARETGAIPPGSSNS